MLHWWPAYVGLGSNLEEPVAQVRRALAELAAVADTRLVAQSRLYRSAPLGGLDQPDYVNAVAGLLTRQTPQRLLESLQAIEAAHGRRRDGPKWGPRTLDLDLLLYADREQREGSLVLPHPGVHERAFVLIPLAEIAPALRIPGHGLVATLAGRCNAAEVRALEGRRGA